MSKRRNKLTKVDCVCVRSKERCSDFYSAVLRRTTDEEKKTKFKDREECSVIIFKNMSTTKQDTFKNDNRISFLCEEEKRIFENQKKEAFMLQSQPFFLDREQ